MTIDRLDQYTTLRRETVQIKRLQEALRESKSNVPAKMYPNLEGIHTELMDHYCAKLQALYEEQLAIESAIDSLPAKLRLLMRYRFIEGMEWEQICTVMKYSWTHIHRLRRKAMKLLSEIEEGRG